MAPNPPVKQLAATGDFPRGEKTSDSALKLWRTALETEDEAFKLQCVNYTYTYPDVSVQSNTPVSVSTEDTALSAEGASVASADALSDWRKAASDCSESKKAKTVAPKRRGLPAMLKIYTPRNNVPWWMTKDWQQGQAKSTFSKLKDFLAGDNYRMATSVAVTALAGYAFVRIINNKQ
ncbi:hypothetical protein BSKO_10555 [Bryopsis sp. KO-2023]|nr:hypothetical protein BSKO_10555 [Bryopsis sp. KO-2023]